jgi:hypothetical protein
MSASIWMFIAHVDKVWGATRPRVVGMFLNMFKALIGLQGHNPIQNNIIPYFLVAV